MAAPALSFENEVFAKFAFYAGIVLLKTIIMSVWTARYRIPKQVFISSEDYRGKKPQSITLDPDIERTRRCHQNDLENVLPFVLIGLLYVLTGPDVGSATLHFRLFAGFRLLHTIAYMFVIPQPTRAIGFFVGFGVNVSMAIAVIKADSPKEWVAKRVKILDYVQTCPVWWVRAATTTADTIYLPGVAVSFRRFTCDYSFKPMDRYKQFFETATHSYDEVNMRTRSVEEKEVGKERDYYDVLHLHKIGIEYKLNLRTKQCNVTQMKTTFRPVGVPPDATFVYEVEVGDPQIPNEHFTSLLFKGTFQDGALYYVQVTSPDCVPVNFDVRSNSTEEHFHESYFNFTIGSLNPSVFTPPPECTKLDV